MSKPTILKFYAGQTVFWLSSKGFAKGIVKKVLHSDEMIPTEPFNQFVKRQTTTKYYLWKEGHAAIYQGDEITDDNIIFTNYKDMLEYYKKNEPK